MRKQHSHLPSSDQIGLEIFKNNGGTLHVGEKIKTISFCIYGFVTHAEDKDPMFPIFLASLSELMDCGYEDEGLYRFSTVGIEYGFHWNGQVTVILRNDWDEGWVPVKTPHNTLAEVKVVRDSEDRGDWKLRFFCQVGFM